MSNRLRSSKVYWLWCDRSPSELTMHWHQHTVNAHRGSTDSTERQQIASYPVSGATLRVATDQKHEDKVQGFSMQWIVQPARLQGDVLYIIQGGEWQIATGKTFPHPFSRCHSPHKSSPVYSSGIKLYLLLSLASTFAAIFLQRRCNYSALPSENPLLKKSKSPTWNKIFFEIPKSRTSFKY